MYTSHLTTVKQSLFFSNALIIVFDNYLLDSIGESPEAAHGKI